MQTHTFYNLNEEPMKFITPTRITPRMKKAFDKILIQSMQYWDWDSNDKDDIPEFIITQEKEGNCQEMFEKVIYRNQQSHLVDWLEQDFDEMLEIIQYFFFSTNKKKLR